MDEDHLVISLLAGMEKTMKEPSCQMETMDWLRRLKDMMAQILNYR